MSTSISETALDLVMPYFPVFPKNPASTDVLDPSVSAILGGSNPILLPGEEWPRCGNCEDNILIPYIQINVSSPQTPEEFRQKVGVEAKPGHTVLLQVFICAEDGTAECFEQRLVGAYDDAFLLRVIQIPPDSANTAAVEATRAELDEDRFFIAPRVISGWTPGNPELLHEAVNNEIEPDDPQYLEHAPAPGLKLLGQPVQGKYYTSILDQCPKPVLREQDHNTRCLLQLGTDSEDGPVFTTGNTWIEQCTVHPEVLSMTIGGDW
ncbi:hypothetical protein L226DRAFT_529739 [Lentinus tigrinus ALCF2SS1-7]|uniref:DUF1963 domain-containing protein n=1 Tax=Lentinus tigrinus ALCF2SS1-6 TaxID=1328759 RepID=A0A5C2SXJ1_9APHY|nr:hypothetical protein L227DRAFT_569526 [Lentinus tigrinus ALCF2SS1-6]RPD81330.1 hypothetical protein L226DRAFT_529739 [Lentinus tigrinus ALCF2SS1-7]